jgi:hypothetical protein
LRTIENLERKERVETTFQDDLLRSFGGFTVFEGYAAMLPVQCFDFGCSTNDFSPTAK